MNDPNQFRPAKPKPNLFTVSVLLAMLFMLIAVIAMFIELGRYEPEYYKTNAARPVVMLPTSDRVTLS